MTYVCAVSLWIDVTYELVKKATLHGYKRYQIGHEVNKLCAVAKF